MNKLAVIKGRIAQIDNSTDHVSGRIFFFTVQLLILVSLVTFSIDTLPNLADDTKRKLQLVEVVTVSFFTLEYFLRIYVAQQRLQFIFSFYGMVDLVAILPFYLASGLDLRTVRIFRFLRLVRILKLLKYSKAIQRYRQALLIVKEELILFGVVTMIVLYLAAVGIYYFESVAQPQYFQSVFHSLWWAVTTLTTVGYGDMYPITMGGKCFTFFVLLIGLGIVAVPTGLIASALSQVRQDHSR